MFLEYKKGPFVPPPPLCNQRYVIITINEEFDNYG